MSVLTAYERLTAVLSGRVRRDETLARHTTFRIGGPAALFIECESLSDLNLTCTILAEEDVPWTVLGKGSNVLASDSGYRGAVLALGAEFRHFEVAGECITAGAGVVLAHLVHEAFHRGLEGMEFAVGIPGTLGGALVMNAGSRDEWIGSVVESVTLFEPGVGLRIVAGHDIEWVYRSSGLADRGVIVEATLGLRGGDVVDIRRSMEASLRRRKRTQPLGAPNAGSVFVNPEGDSAGRLIESSGLKGASVGGAAVSDVHANFVINTGGATASDVLALVELVRNTVKEAQGVELTPEIRFLGSFEIA